MNSISSLQSTKSVISSDEFVRSIDTINNDHYLRVTQGVDLGESLKLRNDLLKELIEVLNKNTSLN